MKKRQVMPVLEALLHQFSFHILGFHSDNRSKFNYRVAEMPGNLLVEFTRSRACRSQHNALVEGKNGALSYASTSATAISRPCMRKLCRSSTQRN